MSNPEVLRAVAPVALPVTSGAVILSGRVESWLLAGFIAVGVISLAVSAGYMRRYIAKR